MGEISECPCHAGHEKAMVTVKRDGAGQPIVWCDPCIASIVGALNAGGFATVASCCGHGRRPGRISLKDGREVFIARSYEEAQQIDALFPKSISDPL